jgi:hypothetical protein
MEMNHRRSIVNVFKVISKPEAAMYLWDKDGSHLLTDHPVCGV